MTESLATEILLLSDTLYPAVFGLFFIFLWSTSHWELMQDMSNNNNKCKKVDVIKSLTKKHTALANQFC